jgi:type I restriction enzyme S subunit
MRGISSIPDGWSVLPLKTFLRPRAERDNADLPLLSVYRDHGVVPFGSIEGNHNKPSLDLSNYKTVREGDLVLNKMKTWQGSLAVSDHEGLVSPAYVVCKVSGDWGRRYLHHLLRSPSFVAEYASLSYGIRVGQWDMRFEDFREVLALHPPVETQRRIVGYLDSETARIDSLIDRKQRFIDLLLEKRTALITHAVTKGLDPDVEMKDSGIEWIGDIPAHWNAVRTKQVARLESGHTPSRQHPEYWENCTVPWITTSEVWQVRDGRAEYIRETKEKVSELGLANSSARKLPAGTVVLSRTASVGFSAIMPVDMATSQDFADWVPGPRVTSEYLLYAFRSMRHEFDRLMMGSTHQTIYMPDIQKLSMPLPPLDEQERIVAYVRHMTGLNDALVDKTRKSVELLKEYRTALISAAVTGQISIPAADSREDVA